MWDRIGLPGSNGAARLDKVEVAGGAGDGVNELVFETLAFNDDCDGGSATR